MFDLLSILINLFQVIFVVNDLGKLGPVLMKLKHDDAARGDPDAQTMALVVLEASLEDVGWVITVLVLLFVATPSI